MKFLFVHQGFPGQYRHIIRALSSNSAHTIIGMGISPLTEPIPTNVRYIQYGLNRGNTPGLHPWLLDIDSKLIRGIACANAAHSLKKDGFNPDIICAHPGWGESLYLKDIWPDTPLLSYQEFFYNAHGFDYDFDPEFQSSEDWMYFASLRTKNANPLLMLESSDWCITPTHFQQSSFPAFCRHKISVIHDGVDTQLAQPSPTRLTLQLNDNVSLSPDDTIITFVNRTIEPYRGCHTFLRSIPFIQEKYPSAKIVIVGSQRGVSYGKAAPNDSWLEYFLPEISDICDLSKVIFTGNLSYSSYIKLLQLSSCHVYLTYPFVLSWSLLEAMSIGCPVVGSRTPPVEEVITHGLNGLLVDFFSPRELSASVDSILSDSLLSKNLSTNARVHILNNYTLNQCVERQLDLIRMVASRTLSS